MLWIFSKKFVDVNHPLTIKAVKKPSFTKKVDYKNIVECLWKTEISDDPDEDKILKKQIANTNFGMLEKSFNKASKSCIFSSCGVAKYYQAQYGGNINSIVEYEHTTSEYLNPLDKGVEGVIPEIHVDSKPTGKELYVLTLCAKASLNNGFRYIKELLMQYHNLYMYNSWENLVDNDIKVFSVKTDAFTILRRDLKQAKELLKFGSEIGGWRMSKDDDINIPFKMIEFKENTWMNITEHKNVDFELSIEDEYNADKLCEIIEKEKRMMIRAEFAGSGKSYTCKHMEKRGHNVVFVCPT
jgi:hypothetical protein